MALHLENHPCFNQSASHTRGRIHLPVAPACNIQCNYCNRKYDCASENRPGVTSSVLSPGQAMIYLDQALERDPRIAVVGIAGPGDPFAEPDATMETLRRVRAKYPEMLLCVATNGLNLAPYVPELAQLGVSHVTITVNAVDPAIAGRIYAWVRDGKRVLRGEEGVRTLLARQAHAIALLKQHGIVVKINTIVMPEINEHHVDEVARTVAELGADLLNVIPIRPVEGSTFENLAEPAVEVMGRLRDTAAQYLPQMRHCTRCRADAAGLIGESLSPCQVELLRDSARLPLEPEEDRPYVAVASMEGVLVNQHLGESAHLWIYGREDGGGFRLIEKRQAPEPGGGTQRWIGLATLLRDCRALLTSGIGGSPKSVLGEHGIRVIEMEGLIESALADVYNGVEIRAPARIWKCGAACAGNGQGCN